MPTASVRREREGFAAELIQKNASTSRLPDQRLVYPRNWEDEHERLAGVAQLMQALVKIARAGTPRCRNRRPELVRIPTSAYR
jgi:hypothetical protein